MPQPGPFDWSVSTAADQIAHLRSLSGEAFREALCAYDWCLLPEPVLGWAMAQREIDLCSALAVFFNGEPARFNYMPKSHVPGDLRGVARVLDNICLRINSGFYLVYPGQSPRCQAKLSTWLTYQQADRSEGRRGRWMLDERILAPMLQNDLRLPPDLAPVKAARPSLWRDLLSPIIGLGVDRDILKYKEPR
ncbi:MULTISPECIES: hypothetical protein [unclassified Roseovarius]|jgi:hypothetical protein|uniref:hypothetical protein n=1 Tax=unclassified Roseovarius TaxID=2614913 RepID=UPI000068585E|nr:MULTISPECIES: hypothetical protein [unclassified Roseovarius]EAQ26737.1 hypothetical protein ROS217_19462 [Roseovarius sp. 217]KJS42448.1 MAG: hypothetical protein VR71_14175 [Roseovarius sp. BRH_c41]